MIEAVRNLTQTTKLVSLFSFLSLLDFLTTKVLVDRAGYDVELNPLLLYAMEMSDSVYAIAWIKLFFLTILWWIAYTINQTYDAPPKPLTYALYIGCVVYFAVVMWNLLVIALTT